MMLIRKTVLVGYGVGNLRWCICKHHLRNFEYKRRFYTPTIVNIEVYIPLLRSNWWTLLPRSSSLPICLKFLLWPLLFACISVAPSWRWSKEGSVHCRASLVSASRLVGPPQATMFPFSELSRPTTTLQCKLVNVWNFFFGVEEVIIKGLVKLECSN